MAEVLKKYRCVLGDTEIDVDAVSEKAAQEQAFARHVRDLSPTDFFVYLADEPLEPVQHWPDFFVEKKA